jgi:hypothetical protein
MTALSRKIGRVGPENAAKAAFGPPTHAPSPSVTSRVASRTFRRWHGTNAATDLAPGCGRAILSDFQPLSNDRFIITCIV